MPKRRNGQTQLRSVAPPPGAEGPRRLTGDALYTWATIQAEVRQLQQQIDSFIQVQAQELGFDPKREGIDPGGYIRLIQTSPEPVQLGENMTRVPEGDDPEG